MIRGDSPTAVLTYPEVAAIMTARGDRIHWTTVKKMERKIKEKIRAAFGGKDPR